MQGKISRRVFLQNKQVVEEADEACFWMEVIIETELLPGIKVTELLKEGNEITAVAASARFNTPSKTNKNFIKK